MNGGPSEWRSGRWRTGITWLFYLLLAIFLVLYVQGLDWRALSSLRPDPLYLLFVLPFSLAARLLQPLAWADLIRDYGQVPPPYSHLSHVYAKSWLGRYIPGKVAWIGGKVFFGSRYGISRGVLAVTSVIEAGIQLITALGVAFLLFSVTGEVAQLPGPLRLFAAIAFVTMMFSLFPPVFNAVVRAAHRLFRGQPLRDELHFSTGGLARIITTYLGIQIVGTAVPFLLVRSIHPELPWALFPYVAAATIFAGALGTLAIFAPSGLGVREGILILLLAAVVPREVALLAVLLMRIWSVAVDVLFYGLTATFVRAAES